MSVIVELASYLRMYADNLETVPVKGTTLRECLTGLTAKYPGLQKMLFAPDGKLLGYVSVFADSARNSLDDLDVPVKDGETLHVLYVIGGG